MDAEDLPLQRVQRDRPRLYARVEALEGEVGGERDSHARGDEPLPHPMVVALEADVRLEACGPARAGDELVTGGAHGGADPQLVGQIVEPDGSAPRRTVPLRQDDADGVVHEVR